MLVLQVASKLRSTSDSDFYVDLKVREKRAPGEALGDEPSYLTANNMPPSTPFTDIASVSSFIKPHACTKDLIECNRLLQERLLRLLLANLANKNAG